MAGKCWKLREDGGKNTEWLYCVEPRDSDVGMCGGIPLIEGEYCLAIGKADGPLFPMAMTKHNLDMSLDERLLHGNLPLGGTTIMKSLENETYPLRMVGKDLDVPRAQLPETPSQQQANVKANSNRSQRIARDFAPDWLQGIPAGVHPLIRTWLVGESTRQGTTNLRAMSLKARLPRCQGYMQKAVAEFTRRGVPKVAALAMIEESACDADAKSDEGAVGLCQFMPETAREYGLQVKFPLGDRYLVDERLDPNKCIPAAAQYVKNHIAALNNKGCTGTAVMKSLMAYNAGLTALMRRNICPASDDRTMAWRGEPGDYIRRILGMAYVLDAGLQGHEVESLNPAPTRLARKGAPARNRSVAEVAPFASRMTGGIPD